MASTFSTSLKLELIGNGDQSGTWGNTTNTNLGTLLEQAVTGVQTITMANADKTLTSLNGVSDEARNAVLVVGGTNSAIRNIIAPSVNKTYIIANNTVGGFAIIIKTSASTGVSIANGATQTVYCNGTEFYTASFPNTGGTITGNLAITGTLGVSGATTLTTASATTPTVGDNTTKVATTAFVTTAVTAATGSLGTMSTQNASAVAITGGTIAGVAISTSTIGGLTVGTNATGTKTISSSAPSGGSDGDIWYQVS